MSLALVTFITGLLSRFGKRFAVLMGLAFASLIIPEAVHRAGALAPDPAATTTLPIDTIPAVGPTASPVSATIALPELLPLSQFRASQGSVQRLAQAITPANDGTGTVVTQPDNNTFNITGGTSAGANLFHSFEQLGLDAGQTANIIANPDIANILGRVVGGDPSVINGLLEVTGNANLFLMNPAGIIFGPQAQVIVPGAFTATTASAIELEDFWFNALGSNEYTNLVKAPSGFAFATSEPGAIINAGALQGESIVLLGGFVINTGTFEVGNSNISIAAVPGEALVRITQDGSLLSIDLPISEALPIEVRNALANDLQNLTVLDIPTLLSGNNIPQALGLVVEGEAVRLADTNSLVPTEVGSGEVYISGDNINFSNYSSNLPLTIRAVDSIGAGNIEATSINLYAINNITIASGILQPYIQNSKPITLVTESGNVQVGFIQQGFTGITTNPGGVDIRSGGSLRVTSYFSDFGYMESIRAASVRLAAEDNILVEHGINTGSFNPENHDGAVILSSTNGDIQVGYIRAGWGGIDITAAGSFRAVGSIETSELFTPGQQGDNGEKLNLSLLALSFGAGSDPQIARLPSIRIQYGNAQQLLLNQRVNVEGTNESSQIFILGDTSRLFKMGPIALENEDNSSSENRSFINSQDSGLIAGIGISESLNNFLLGSVGDITFQPPSRDHDPEPPTPRDHDPEPPTPNSIYSTPRLNSPNSTVEVSNFCDSETTDLSFNSDILEIDKRSVPDLPTNELSPEEDPCTSGIIPTGSESILPEGPETLEP